STPIYTLSLHDALPISYGANVDARSGQTYFRPPIYLKSGPLLRFRGIYKEKTRSARSPTSRERDVWRGSVMIVTIDHKSRYETRSEEHTSELQSLRHLV